MKVIISKRDLLVFHFLWKWKISTTAYLQITFFPNLAPHTAYLRLLKLRKSGYLTLIHSTDGFHKYWGLTSKGFAKVKPYIPPIKNENYRPSSLEHDMKTQVVQLGIFDSIEAKNVVNISEQELRSESDYLPKKLKNFSHRPDGYWVFDGDKGVALEIELSYKSQLGYYDLAFKYDANKFIKGVLWVVESHAMVVRIMQQVERFAGNSGHKYSIIYYQDFIKFGTDCKIIGGQGRGNKLSILLEQMGAVCLRLPNNPSRTQALTQTRVSNW